MNTEKDPLSRRQLIKGVGLAGAAGLAALLSSCAGPRGGARRTGRRTARRVTRRRL